jgi:predicted nuclease with TOPRIM domain
MADNPPTPKSGPLPPLPSSGMTGRLPPTTQLPVKRGGPGKIVVMLSSVAKPPTQSQSLLPLPAVTPDAPPKVVPTTDSSPLPVRRRPPPLPPKQVSPAAAPLPSRLSATTYVKLPPKTSVPRLASLVGTPGIVRPGKEPASKVSPPPLPAKWSEPKSGAQHIPPIKLSEPPPSEDSADSLFLSPSKPAPAEKPKGWKNLQPGELNPPKGDLESLEVFARSQRLGATATPATPVPKEDAVLAKAPEPTQHPPLPSTTPAENPAPHPLHVAPPLLESVAEPHAGKLPPPLAPESPAAHPLHVAPPMMESATEPHAGKLPPPLAPESPAAHPLHIAPPMMESAAEPHAEKLRQPHLPPVLPDSSAVQKVPALIPSETVTPEHPLPMPASPGVKPAATADTMTKSVPLVVSSSSPASPAAKIAEAKAPEIKSLLKPAVLPKRAVALAQAVEVEAPATPPLKTAPENPAPAGLAIPLPETIPVVPPPSVPASAGPLVPPEKVTPPPSAPATSSSKAPLPLTRAARAKKRRLVEVIVFYVLFAFTAVALFLGGLYFCRETRVEGQVIPPQGMTLNNEVWIVSDFRELASGIAEDLAAERTPLLQEIQERQEHVQRSQADVASREERIRLIQEEMQASKDEITSLVKKSRDDTQQIWDGPGAQIDAEYASRLDQLQKSIADRAKSLNLKYQPDPAFNSPEVWANAYRLALYEVPAGVDTVKEHQWLGDQMKAWRDFLKSLDDRKEQLREQAAQLKLAPAPQITDLNTKIDDMQHRVDSTAAEEVPLKAELQQAQADLAQAQTADAGLDEKYYKQLDSLPGEAITKHIPLLSNGRFSWVEDDIFVEGEKEHHYWIFSRATRADKRQYWALHHFSVSKNETLELIIDPDGFLSTKAILRPDLSPDEQAQ